MDGTSLELAIQVADVAGAVLWGGTEHATDFFSDRWVSAMGDTREAWLERGAQLSAPSISSMAASRIFTGSPIDGSRAARPSGRLSAARGVA